MAKLNKYGVPELTPEEQETAHLEPAQRKTIYKGVDITPPVGSGRSPVLLPGQSNAITAINKAEAEEVDAAYEPQRLATIGEAAQAAVNRGPVAAPLPALTALTTDTQLRDIANRAMSTTEKMEAEMMTKGGQHLPPSQRKDIQQREEQRLASLTSQRDAAYAAEVKKVADAKEARKMGREDIADILVVARTAKLVQEGITNNLNMALNRKMLEATLREKELKNESTEIEKGKLAQLRATPTPVPRVVTDENTILSAADVKTTKLPYERIREVVLQNGVSPAAADALSASVLANTFDSSVELMKAVDVDLGEGVLPTVTGSEVNAYIQEARDTFSENTEPEEAVKQIASDTELDPDDKNYAQSILNISEAVMRVYKEAGNEALPEIQAAIQRRRRQSEQTATTRVADEVPRLATPEGWNNLIQSTLNTMDSTAALTGSVTGVDAALLQKQRRDSLGLGDATQYGEMDSDQIKAMLIDNMFGNPETNPALKAWVNDPQNQAPGTPFQRMLSAGVAEAQKGQKTWTMEREKKQKEEQAEQEKVQKQAQDYATENSLVVRFDPTDAKKQPIYFFTGEQADQYDKASSAMKPIIAANVRAITQKKLADPNYQNFLELPSASERSKVRTTILLAKNAYEQFIVTGEDSFPSTSAFSELNVAKPSELPFAVNAYSDTYGLGEVFEQTQVPGWLFSKDQWSVIPEPDLSVAQESSQPEEKQITRTDTTGRVWTLKDGQWK